MNPTHFCTRQAPAAPAAGRGALGFLRSLSCVYACVGVCVREKDHKNEWHELDFLQLVE